MSIDGLNNLPGIIPVKKEKGAGDNSRKNQQKDKNKEDRKDNIPEEEQKEKSGRIDIRI